jgi:hypothetical protein
VFFAANFLPIPENGIHWLQLNGGCGQIRPGALSREQVHGSTVRGFQPTRLENEWKSCFDDSTENSEEPIYFRNSHISNVSITLINTQVTMGK